MAAAIGKGVLGVILAGGLGTRLRAVVADKPKVLAEVNGRPFLSYLLTQFERAGIEKCVLCTGHLAEQVEQIFGEQFGKMSLAYSREEAPLGTAGAFRLAAGAYPFEHYLLMNGDSWCSVDLAKVIKFHLNSKADATITSVKLDERGRFGSLDIGANGKVLGFREKDSSSSGWINAGIYIISHGLASAIPAGKPLSLEKDFFPRWLQK